MRLTMQDKNELLKAAVKATDLDSLKRYVVSLVDAADTADIGSGKADTVTSVPAYSETRTANRPAAQEWTHDYLAPNGAPQR